jgi:pimeloyl-ACP methyl ester carboxylesterase
MGGMIVQELCIRHSSLVASLTSIMSTPDVRVGGAREEAKGVLVAPPPRSREEAMERAVEVYGVVGSKRYPADAASLRLLAGEAFDRCFDPAGAGRQLLAIWSSPARTERLRQRVICPALVIHGLEDPLITVEGGRATAKAIPHAELVEIADMGHDFPVQLWHDIIAPIVRLVARANNSAASGSQSVAPTQQAALPAAKL